MEYSHKDYNEINSNNGNNENNINYEIHINNINNENDTNNENNINNEKNVNNENNIDNDNEVEIKKQYLTEEILNKGYNTNEFLNFCLNKKENGDDLAFWEIGELKECVKEFQMQVKKQKENVEKKTTTSMKSFLFSNKSINNNPNINFNGDNISNKENYLQSSQINQRINESIQNVNIGSNSDNYYNECNNNIRIYKKEINCKILEKSELNSKKITIKIQNPKQINASILSSAYTTYEVYCPEMKWLVNRRYSDFDWLRNTLKKFFPRHLIPPLPGKKIGARRFDQDFIEKRMKFLQKFLNEVMNVETFKASEALVSFLKMTDREQFDRKIKEMNSLIYSNYIQDIKTLSGKIMVIDDENNEKYYTNINNYFRLQIQIYNRLNYNLKCYYRNINYACRNLEEVQKDFDTLEKLNAKVQMKPEIIKTYEELFIFFKNWGRILSNENEIIKEKIKEFFKYQKMENIAYTELIQTREEIKNVYIMAKKKLDDKKLKLYSYMDVNKWEIEENYNNLNFSLIYRDKNYAWEKMCTKETQALELLHQQIGYANQMNFSQLKRLIIKNNKLFVDNTKEFANAFYPSLNDSITLWSTLNTYI